MLVVTVLVGVITLAEFADPRRMATMPGVVRLVAGHLTLALAAVTVWTIYLVNKTGPLAWVGSGVLAGTAAAGLFLFRRSRQPLPDATDDDDVHVVGPGVLVVHGAAAALTIVLAVAAAVGQQR